MPNDFQTASLQTASPNSTNRSGKSKSFLPSNKIETISSEFPLFIGNSSCRLILRQTPTSPIFPSGAIVPNPHSKTHPTATTSPQDTQKKCPPSPSNGTLVKPISHLHLRTAVTPIITATHHHAPPLPFQQSQFTTRCHLRSAPLSSTALLAPHFSPPSAPTQTLPPNSSLTPTQHYNQLCNTTPTVTTRPQPATQPFKRPYCTLHYSAEPFSLPTPKSPPFLEPHDPTPTFSTSLTSPRPLKSPIILDNACFLNRTKCKLIYSADTSFLPPPKLLSFLAPQNPTPIFCTTPSSPRPSTSQISWDNACSFNLTNDITLISQLYPPFQLAE